LSAHLFWRIASLEARKLMSYRVDFWVNSVAALGAELVVAFYLWQAIFTATGRDVIGGYTFRGMLLYYVLVILAGKLVRGQERDLGIARDIYEGTLTRYLIYPAPYAGFKYAEHVGALLPSLVQVTLFGAAAAWWLPLPDDVSITWATAGMAAVAIVGGNLLAFSLRFPIQGVAFWADNVWSLNVMLRLVTDLLGGLLLPLSIFPAAAQQILAWLPFRYLFAFPVETLLGRLTFGEWLQGLLVTTLWIGLLAALSSVVWRRGGKVYTGVGI
jgi:viologen exporter family transport system permease protein